MQTDVLLSEYLKKWYYTYTSVSYTFSQSYCYVAVKRGKRHRQ